MIQAIETVYKGYRFRSRLEARWAVFFEALKMKWEYEKEGYDLSNVPPLTHCYKDANGQEHTYTESQTPLAGTETWYLPDFWLPQQSCWVEVKPVAPTDIETERAHRLARLTGHDVYIVTGNPWIASGHYGYDDSDSAYRHFATGGWDNYYQLTACPSCGVVDFCFSGWAERLPCSCPNGKKDEGDIERVERAYLAARQARFEHGEKGW